MSLRQTVKTVMMMKKVTKQFEEGVMAAPKKPPSGPVARGRSLDVHWIQADPCGIALGPVAWTQKMTTSRHRALRSEPDIRRPRRTVWETTVVQGVPRGKAVDTEIGRTPPPTSSRAERRRQRFARSQGGTSGLGAAPEKRWADKAGWEISYGGPVAQFQAFWKQLEAQGWRSRVRKRPQGRLDKSSGGSTPLGASWKKTAPHSLVESYVRPGRWGPGERHSAKHGVDYFDTPHALFAFLRRAPHQLMHTQGGAGVGAPHFHLFGLT